MKLSKIFLTSLAILCAVASTPISSSRAADHGDAPGVRQQGNLDINDVYLFPSPNDATKVVLIMTVSPFAGITGPLTFDPNGIYEFAVDNDADAKADLLLTATFSKPNKNGVQIAKLFKSDEKGKNARKIAQGKTGNTLNVKGGGSFIASNFDDPFFFDLLSFRNGLNFCTGSARNFFSGLNTLALALEIPSSVVKKGASTKFGIWARTFEIKTSIVRRATVKRVVQFDRMGRPAINTVLVKAENKDLFNASQPATDRAKFKPYAVQVITSLGNTASGASALADILFPDILTIDLASAVGFPNGRQLTDDVIDTELQLITGNNAATDCIANDSTFQAVFPYLGVKNP